MAVWWEENIEGNKIAELAVDKARDQVPGGLGKPAEKALELIFKAVFKTTKYSAIAVSAALAPFEASRQPSYKAAYLDSRFGVEYYSKQERLAQIYRELFHQMPPSLPVLNVVDRCNVEACWEKK